MVGDNHKFHSKTIKMTIMKKIYLKPELETQLECLDGDLLFASQTGDEYNPDDPTYARRGGHSNFDDEDFDDE